MDIIYKISEFIDEFDSQNVGNVFILAVAVCVLAIMILILVNYDSAEEIFMDKKKRFISYLFKFSSMSVVFTLANIVLVKASIFFVLGIPCFLIAFVSFLIYKWRTSRKYPKKLSKIGLFYIEKRDNALIISIILIAPFFAVSLNKLAIPLVNCVVIVSVLEVFFICVFISGLIIHESTLCLTIQKKEVYILTVIGNNNILCGDKPSLSKSDKYYFIGYEDLKGRVIGHTKYKNLSPKEKKDLKKRYKKYKDKKRKAIIIKIKNFVNQRCPWWHKHS